MAPAPVLFCSHVVDWGGAERVLADLLATLDGRQFLPHLACPGDGPLPARARELGVPVHSAPLGGRTRLRKLLGIPRAGAALRQLAAQLSCRLLVANTMLAGYAAVRAQHDRLACLWHLHIVPGSWFARRSLRRAAAVVTPSRAGAAAVDPRLLAHGRLHVVPNGVDRRFFAPPPATLRVGLGLPAATPLVGIVTRLDPPKGHEVLLRAFAGLPAAVGAHLVVVGGEAFAGHEARVRGFGARLAALAATLGIADRTHFLGHRDDAAAILGQLDVVAAPSTAPESAPRAISEAQAAGCAVVASAIGGTGELIRHGHDGLLVPAGDVGALRVAIGVLLADPERRRALGAAGRARALADHSLPAFARRFEAVCREVLAGLPA
ncbi:MAG: glycosyltransferase [Planctomycetes bacterium]|nr:glycosyltransferase [Planctomycetota bacterium]